MKVVYTFALDFSMKLFKIMDEIVVYFDNRNAIST